MTLVFATDSGEPFEFDFEKIFVMKHKGIDEKVRRIPSILGRDFLNQFTLIYSRKDEKASITDQEPA